MAFTTANLSAWGMAAKRLPSVLVPKMTVGNWVVVDIVKKTLLDNNRQREQRGPPGPRGECTEPGKDTTSHTLLHEDAIRVTRSFNENKREFIDILSSGHKIVLSALMILYIDLVDEFNVEYLSLFYQLLSSFHKHNRNKNLFSHY